MSSAAVSAAAPARESEQQRVEEFRERTSRKLAGVLCPLHHQAPRLRIHGNTLRDVTIQMSGCCNHLLGLANRRIAEP